MSKFFSAIGQSLKRISLLLRLQFVQKFKYATSVKKIVFKNVISVVLSVLIAFALRFAMTYFNFITAFSYNENMLAFIIMIFFIISIISSVVNVISQIYKSTDNEFLFATPVKPEEVFVSKLLIVIYQEFTSSLFIFLPILIAYGLGAGASMFGQSMNIGAHYYIVSVIMTLVIPILSVTLGVLLSVPIYFTTKFVAKYTVTKFSSVFVLLGLAIWFFYWLVNIVIKGLNYLSQLNVLARELNLFLYQFANKTWVFKTLANAFNGNYLTIFIVFAITAVLFVGAYFSMKALYFKLVLSPVGERYKNKQSKKQKQLSKGQTIFSKDLNMLFSKGGDFFKYFSIAVIVPFFLVVLNSIFSINEVSLVGKYLILATNILIISMFTCMNCSYTATSLTMEGANFYIMQTTPVSLKKQLYSKLLINLIINGIIILSSCLTMYFTTPVKFVWTVLAFFVCLLVNVGFLCYTLTVELQNPMIDWHDKSEITSHKNTTKCSLMGLLTGLITGAFAFKFYLIAPQRAWFELLILAGVFAGYNIYLLIRKQNYLIKQINK